MTYIFKVFSKMGLFFTTRTQREFIPTSKREFIPTSKREFKHKVKMLEHLIFVHKSEKSKNLKI